MAKGQYRRDGRLGRWGGLSCDRRRRSGEAVWCIYRGTGAPARPCEDAGSEGWRWQESRRGPPLADLSQTGRRSVILPVRLETDDVRGQPTEGAAPDAFPWQRQAWPSPQPAFSAPAAHSSEEHSPSAPAASGYTRSSNSRAVMNVAVPRGPDPVVSADGGGGATGGPVPLGRGAGGAGPRPFRCAATALRRARPWARTSGDWAGHSHTQCLRWPQMEQASCCRAWGPDSGTPPDAPPHGGGALPRGNRGGRSEYKETVPARGGTGVPGARVLRPRPTPVRTGYSAGCPPHASCCCHQDACGRLSSGRIGTSSGWPFPTGVAAAAIIAAHSARSASVP